MANEIIYYNNKGRVRPAKMILADRATSQRITSKTFLKRLITLQIVSTCIMFLAVVLQGVAIGTSDWFVLNVNEYIPTSKGGLWFYCYVSPNAPATGQLTCVKYEDLPNFSVFVNSRLYDSRVLLLCSCGFCVLLVIIEIVGVIVLCMAGSRRDVLDSYVAKKSSRFRMMDKEPLDVNFSRSPRNMQVKNYPSGDSTRQYDDDDDMTNNSARFTTSIVINADAKTKETYKTIRPTGYFAYLAVSLITLVGSVMDFVLKVSGFALFDSYINNLLSFNISFLSYRSYSYWFMVVSLVLTIIFWLYKVFSTKYVISMTEKLIGTKQSIYVTKPSLPYKGSKTDYTSISKIQTKINDNKLNHHVNSSKEFQTYPIKKALVYNVEPNEDDLSSASYSYRAESSFYQNLNSNYYHEYFNLENKISNLKTKSAPEMNSAVSIIKF